MEVPAHATSFRGWSCTICNCHGQSSGMVHNNSSGAIASLGHVQLLNDRVCLRLRLWLTHFRVLPSSVPGYVDVFSFCFASVGGARGQHQHCLITDSKSAFYILTKKLLFSIMQLCNSYRPSYSSPLTLSTSLAAKYRKHCRVENKKETQPSLGMPCPASRYRHCPLCPDRLRLYWTNNSKWSLLADINGMRWHDIDMAQPVV